MSAPRHTAHLPCAVCGRTGPVLSPTAPGSDKWEAGKVVLACWKCIAEDAELRRMLEPAPAPGPCRCPSRPATHADWTHPND